MSHSRKKRRPHESEAQYNARMEAQERLLNQVRDEVELAYAYQRARKADVARRMGVSPTSLSARRAGEGYSLAYLADLGVALGVQFRVTAIPLNDAIDQRQRPRYDRLFSDKDVREIRARAREGVPARQIARALGVSPSTIQEMVRFKTYTHVLDVEEAGDG